MKRISENHSFNIHIASLLKGNVKKAILLKEIYGWVHQNLINKKNVKFGIVWTYNSAEAFGLKFPYMSAKSIDRWLRELERDGWLFSGKYNKKGYDKTKWYTINYIRYDDGCLGSSHTLPQNEEWITQIEGLITQNEELITQIEYPIPSLNTSNKPTSKTDSLFKEKKLSNLDHSIKQNTKTPQTTPKTKTSKEKEKISAKKEKEAKEIIDKANPVVEDDGLKVLQASAKLKQTILTYLQQNPSVLTLIKDKAKWRGGVESELEGWCDHHCDSHKAKTKPHSHFSKTFPSWLMRAKQFSRSKGSTKPNTPKPSFDYSGGRDLHNATF